MPVRSGLALGVLFAGLAAAASGSASDTAFVTAGQDFAVQAAPEAASAVNRVLSQVAQPVELALRPGETADALFQRLCGVAAPPTVEASTGTAGPTVLAAPCARQARDVRLRVLPHARLEAMALSLGLTRGGAKSLRVLPAPGSGRTGAVAETEMRAGDIVVAPQKPLWTNFTLRADQPPGRTALLARFADALGCGGRPAETCLSENGVALVQREPPRPVILPEPRGPAAEPPEKAPPADGVSDATWPGEGVQRIARPRLLLQDGVTGAGGQAPSPAVEVAPDQWPYDRSLVNRLLGAVEAAKGPLRPTTIGVADVGLATWRGGPLKPDMFAEVETDDPANGPPAGPDQPNGQDDDGDSWVDDLIGAGTERENVYRSQDDLKTGDVSLCRKAVDFNTWSAADLRLASHGPMVASLAAGYPLADNRAAAPTRGLPKVTFYRLAGELCQPNQPISVGDQELLSAFDYLLPRANIVAISFMGGSSSAGNFGNRIKQVLGLQQKLLFLPAGEDPPPNIDGPNAPCPQCLAAKGEFAVRSRLTVVGAATSNLQRAAYSGYGKSGVRLYAPGEPLGAVDIRGQAADPKQAATSFATPLAALAAALLDSYGDQIGDVAAVKVRGRLLLSTWDLQDPAYPDAGVLDLIKVAAAFHNVVEVREPIAGGRLVLRDYVGVITDGLRNICGSSVSGALYQAIRLGPADADKDRLITFYRRDVDDDTGELKSTAPRKCQPQGSVELKDLDGRAHQIELSNVTKIMLSWSPNWRLGPSGPIGP